MMRPAIILLAGAVAAVPACAETMAYSVPLSGANEVPPNTSAGKGTAQISLDTVTRNVSWVVTYSGLTGPALGMHLHGPTDPGRNAGIVVPFYGVLESPVRGTAQLSPAQAEEMTTGKWYVNVHTQRHPGGELRGQVVR